MRIDSTNRIGLTPQSATAIRAQPRRGEDQVRLSIPDHSEKLNRIAAAVSNGTYRVSAMQIAASMMNDMFLRA